MSGVLKGKLIEFNQALWVVLDHFEDGELLCQSVESPINRLNVGAKFVKVIG